MEVQLSGTLRDAADGAASISVNAETIRELLRKVVERYPRVQGIMDNEGVSVAIDGEIYRDNWAQLIPSNSEVVLLPRIPGG